MRVTTETDAIHPSPAALLDLVLDLDQPPGQAWVHLAFDQRLRHLQGSVFSIRSWR
jgi:hypothetical protein